MRSTSQLGEFSGDDPQEVEAGGAEVDRSEHAMLVVPEVAQEEEERVEEVVASFTHLPYVVSHL